MLTCGGPPIDAARAHLHAQQARQHQHEAACWCSSRHLEHCMIMHDMVSSSSGRLTGSMLGVVLLANVGQAKVASSRSRAAATTTQPATSWVCPSAAAPRPLTASLTLRKTLPLAPRGEAFAGTASCKTAAAVRAAPDGRQRCIRQPEIDRNGALGKML